MVHRQPVVVATAARARGQILKWRKACPEPKSNGPLACELTTIVRRGDLFRRRAETNFNLLQIHTKDPDEEKAAGSRAGVRSQSKNGAAPPLASEIDVGKSDPSPIGFTLFL